MEEENFFEATHSRDGIAEIRSGENDARAVAY